ncbi:CapA family protein [Streptococcus suis]|uniref:CapA family protein n=1 Tax=Streptococcus suis TaxID=1307 RepID=UPI000CF5D17B|nr:CapA family protein [Streptococcus suis]MBS8086558.1 CapA family protein [Streptococcus suis]MCO8220381.1 CapA family protein [Streptococcus suis]HEM3481176.1 CapA family protein [Streptococcus suis]HEM3512229.1 CapA family protein [Streptococcus suis]HEM3524918.1 CapA family protein [Streptococcus suis]
MEKRANYIRRKRYASYRTKMHLFFICGLATIILAIIIVSEHLVPRLNQASETMHSDNSVRIMAHGDLLYHLPILRGAEQPDGSYDFSENFTYVKPWIEQADFAIADFEGTISPDVELAGYPLFNAPAVVANNIHDAGYDLVDLAHNHILDSHLSGLISTVNTFRDAGVDTVGVYAEGNRATAPLYIREVNGIRIAVLAYAYGFNGMEALLSQEEYDAYLSDFDKEKMRAEIERAEKEADITIVMPQTGVEYQLEPTEEQISLYHQMVDWGADLVFGGHPHVTEPAEIVEKDGQRKLIIYSMGNFLSNQRQETMTDEVNAKWTERGVLMDIRIQKENGQTSIQTAQAHPTWVNRISQGTYSLDGYERFSYQTYVLEDWVAGGRYYGQLDEETQARVDAAYQEMKDFVNLVW